MTRAPDQAAQISTGEIDRIIAGTHHNPHSVLGAHLVGGGVTVRALVPMAASVTVVLNDGSRFPLTHVHEGVFGATLPLPQIPDYRLAVTYPAPDSGTSGSGTSGSGTSGSGTSGSGTSGSGTSGSSTSGSSTSGSSTAAPEIIIDDPYRYLPTLGEMDLYLIGEGRHEELWRVLGAHVRAYGPGPGGFGTTRGTSFAVWAPNAQGVRVIGDLNHWDGRGHPMRSLGGAGVWELFVPGATEGTRYKYEIRGADGQWHRKADPMANLAERPPATASVVYSSSYQWEDRDWIDARARGERTREPLSIYEVHLGSWRPGLSYRQLAGELTSYVTEMGFTHVEFLPAAEHPFGGSWGYQVTSYYAPTSRFGDPDDLRYLIDRLHQAGIGVILDWVPAHFPRDEWALARFDGTALYEHADPRRGEHPDWGTLIFNYGRAEVRNFLVANSLYWLEEFHVDGLRVDAVASMLYLDYSRKADEWEPNAQGGRENLDAVSFLQEVNATCYRQVPGIMMIAEESTAWPGVTRPVHLGGLGFGFKWNLGWMHDTLSYLAHDPMFRSYHHNEITFSLMYAFLENFMLPLSHDEVVHGKGSLLGKMPGDEWKRFAGLRTLFAFMWAHPGKQLLFMGSEFGQGSEWSAENGVDWWVLDFEYHAGVQRLVRDLNKAYRDNPALWELDTSPDGFSWIDANDAAGNVLSFLRRTGTGADAKVLACIINFSGTTHNAYRVGLPQSGRWRELINTDAYDYGGSGAGNMGVVEAAEKPWHGQPASAVLTVPPLGALWLTPE